MGGFWSDLSGRERGLIYLAGGLMAVLLLVSLVIRPIVSMRQNAVNSYDDAVETFTIVKRAALRPGGSAASDPSAVRSLITRTATRFGLIIERINSQGDVHDLSVGNADLGVLYAWLDELERDHSVIVTSAAIRPSSDGKSVTARLGLVQVAG